MNGQLVTEIQEFKELHQEKIQEKIQEIQSLLPEYSFKVTDLAIEDAIVTLKVIHGIEIEDTVDIILNMIDEASKEEENEI